MDKARAYMENWKEAYRNNTGLLLFGDVGTGKSFFAGCIANALPFSPVVSPTPCLTGMCRC